MSIQQTMLDTWGRRYYPPLMEAEPGVERHVWRMAVVLSLKWRTAQLMHARENTYAAMYRTSSIEVYRYLHRQGLEPRDCVRMWHRALKATR